MTLSIALVLAILVVSLVLFVTEWVRMDVVALLVLGALAVTGLVSPGEALSGFSNPAVVTVWAMFILSAGLAQTGVAEWIGQRLLGWVGSGEARMVMVIMLTAGVMSAFMNNIGVAALMMPVVITIARRTGRPPSRLLMPLAYGSLLGGLTTLIGTPPNILVSESLSQQGLTPFAMFDFTPVGGLAMLAGIVFVALAGRHLLPARDPVQEGTAGQPTDLRRAYTMDEQSAVMRVPAGSPLIGMTLGQSRLGSATGLNVYAIVKNGTTRLAPGPDMVLAAGDRLLVSGALDRWNDLRDWRKLVIEREEPGFGRLMSAELGLAALRLAPDSALAGRTLGQIGFRQRYGAAVLAIRRDGSVILEHLVDVTLAVGDHLLLQGRSDRLAALSDDADFDESEKVSPETMLLDYRLEHRIFALRLPGDSHLIGKTLKETRLGDALGLGVLGRIAEGATPTLADPDEPLSAEDRLLVRGRPEALDVFRGLQSLEVVGEAAAVPRTLESEEIGMAEVALAPRTRLPGKTLRELAFRERYGLQALAILREGRTLHAGLRDVPLRFGDALLLAGPREKLKLLSGEPDFLVLTQVVREAPRTHRAPVAVLIMGAVLLPVLLGWLPIAIAAVAGVALMVLTRCLEMEEAYRAIEWRSVFLIAGMLPLGAALQRTGAASLLADGVMEVTGSLGPSGILLGLYLVTAAATTIIPTAALVVLMAPIVYRACAEAGISPEAAMMAVAIAASASFTSPISHPANVLVMGPGGYRFVDYVKLGLPLAIVVLLTVVLVLPIFWPLQP
jgi:di/tricarboxylate transporter